MKQNISKPARERLIMLARLLGDLENDLCEVITSSEIQKRTGWKSDTIRRDISLLDKNCATKSGYDVKTLREAISSEMGLLHDEKRCCIVGLGKLGSALLDYKGFDGTPFTIVAGFDTSTNRTEILSADFPLYPTSRMQSIIKQENIEYAILAVPEKSAQAVATKLAACGIKGIANYSSAVLTVPAGTNVENISVVGALERLAAIQKQGF